MFDVHLQRRSLLLCGGMVLMAFAVPVPARAGDFQSDRISVRRVGSGPDVILIPGLTSSPEIWEGTVRAVPGYRYHLVQLNGFAGHPARGNSEGPVIASAAEEIARYIREQGLDRPAIIGHSMGGTIALSIAARHDLASKVMVVDMLPALGVLFAPPGSSAETLRATADALRDRSLQSSAEERRKTIEASIATMVSDEALRVAPVRHALTSDRAVSARAFHELILTDLRPELGKIEVPVTVLYVKTPNVPLTETQFDALYKSSYAGLEEVVLKRIPFSYHFIMYDKPNIFADEVRRFLRPRT